MRKLLVLLSLLVALVSCGGGGGGDGGGDGGGSSHTPHAACSFTEWIEYVGYQETWAVRGIVQNTGDRRADYVRVRADLYDKAGKYLETVLKYVDDTHIEAGANSSFNTYYFSETPKDNVGSVKRSITWSEFKTRQPKTVDESKFRKR